MSNRVIHQWERELFGEDWEPPETMTQQCCGLVYPWESRDHLAEAWCKYGHCTLLYCQCGVLDVEWGPVFCPHKARERWGWTLPVPDMRGYSRRYRARRGKKYRNRRRR